VPFSLAVTDNVEFHAEANMMDRTKVDNAEFAVNINFKNFSICLFGFGLCTFLIYKFVFTNNLAELVNLALELHALFFGAFFLKPASLLLAHYLTV
jgi:hypothetical protein